MKLEEKNITKSAEETIKIAENLAKKIKPGDFIALFGELGGGKTTFTQGLVKGLNIKKRIISPTFIIIREYDIPGKNYKFYHIDLYRINMEDYEVSELGLSEILEEGKGIVVVEWAEKMGKFLPKKRKEIYFKYLSENRREITIKEFL